MIGATLVRGQQDSTDTRDGQRILEIGTGTGYNAALLAHRLGDDNVFSLDIDPELVDTARRRLARIGRHPHLAAGDGADGWSQHGPYHRIICTCAVRRIPWAWYDQLVPGGRVLVDFKPQGGNLVLLEKKADRLEGRFTARYAAFMVMRQHDDNDDRPSSPWQPELPLNRQRTTITPAEPPGVVRFLRSVTSSTQLRHGTPSTSKPGNPPRLDLPLRTGPVAKWNSPQTARVPAPYERADPHGYGRRLKTLTNNGMTGANRVGTGSASR